MKTLDLGDGARVILHPDGRVVLEVERRTRQARKRLNEFLAEWGARIAERGDRWMFFDSGDFWSDWPDFENGMSFRIEDGRIAYPTHRDLVEKKVSEYQEWWLQTND